MPDSVRVRLAACAHLPTVRLGAAPDALVEHYGDELGETPDGVELVVDARPLDEGGYAFGRTAVEAIATHLSDLGCVVRLDPANILVTFPGGPAVEAPRSAHGDWPVGSDVLEWREVSPNEDALSTLGDDSE